MFLTSLVFWIERTKNELQYNAENYPEASKNRYIKAATTIWKEQGFRGFFRGFHPKVLSNAVAAVGASILVELGQKSMQKK